MYYTSILFTLLILNNCFDISQLPNLHSQKYQRTSLKDITIHPVDTTKFASLTDPSFPAIPGLASGYLPVGDTIDSQIGFTLFPCQLDPANFKNYPFLFWIDDFGSSSLLSTFFQTGRFLLQGKNDEGKFKIFQNKNSLDTQYNLVYLDIVGSGISDTKSDTDVPLDTATAINQLYYAMDAFFAYLGNKVPIYLAGRAYGARYVAQLANLYIAKGEGSTVAGVILINGHISPASVAKELGEFSYDLGLLDFQQRKQAELYSLNIIKNVKNNDNAAAFSNFVDSLKFITTNSGVNLLDYSNGGYLTEHRNVNQVLIDQFFNKPQVVDGFGFTYKIYSSINSVNLIKNKDTLTSSSVGAVQNVIKALKKLLIIQGQTEVVYNTLSALDWVENLPIPEWKNQLFTLRKLNSMTVGHERVFGKTRFIFFDKSGRYLLNSELILSLFNEFKK